MSEAIAERRLEQAVATEAKAIMSACQQLQTYIAAGRQEDQDPHQGSGRGRVAPAGDGSRGIDSSVYPVVGRNCGLPTYLLKGSET